MRKRIFFSVCVLLGVFCARAGADEQAINLSDQVAQEIRIAKPSTWVEKFQSARNTFEDKYGTSFAVVANMQNPVSLASETNQGKYRSAWYYNVALEQRLWQGASTVFEVEGGNGKGIDKLLPTFSVLDGDAGEITAIYVTEFYLRQKFYDDKIYFVGGRMDLSDWCDTNEVANSSDLQFLSSSLVGNLTIPFPKKGLGAMFGVKPFEWLYFQTGASNANASSTQIGVRRAFESTFFINELGLTPKLGKLQGKYRLISWVNRKKEDYLNGEGEKNVTTGFALSFDQQITQKVSLFFRYGLADGKVEAIENLWSTGGEIRELIPGRKTDVLGLGVNQSIFGSDYKKSRGENTAKAETIYELYYNFNLHPFVKIIPNLQVVTDPDAEKDICPDVVLGARVAVII
ncbi:MAG: carbohydrate porin [Candidatus Omnitrophota bacterium]